MFIFIFLLKKYSVIIAARKYYPENMHPLKFNGRFLDYICGGVVLESFVSNFIKETRAVAVVVSHSHFVMVADKRCVFRLIANEKCISE